MAIFDRSRRRFAGRVQRGWSSLRRTALQVERLEERAVPAAIPTPPIFQNPFMAPNNFSEIHLNSQQTDTGSISGPGSSSSQSVQQGLIGPIPFAISGTAAFNSRGQLLTISVGAEPQGNQIVRGSQTLLLIDPTSLQVIASADLPPRPVSSGSVSFAGGGYFYVDNQDRVVCVTANQQIRIYAVQNNSFVQAQGYDLSGTLATTTNSSDILNSVLPDSFGNLWFITKLGAVGYVNPTTGAISITTFQSVPGSDPNETNTKSFASDGDGGVYVVSDFALYRFLAGPGGTVANSWRSAYDRGTRVKPGQNQQGCGTTPTCFDDASGNQFITIADNADPFMHINVYDRKTGALVAQQAVFSNFPFVNSCENSLVAVNHTVFIENNYGNVNIDSTAGSATTVPGVDRVDFNPLTHTSTVVWENTQVAIPSVVSQLSTGDGLFYTYAKDAQGWYWATLDGNTGNVTAATRVPWSNVGDGRLANNFYSGLTVGPDGSAYVGTFGGFVVWRPANYLDRAFVVASFEDLLGRYPEPSALDYWTNRVVQFGRFQSVLEIENTFEFRRNVVENLYMRYLNRQADVPGLLNSVQLLADGFTINQLSASLIASPEFYQLNGGTTTGFLNGMYMDVFHRPIDPQALAVDTQLLSSGFSSFLLAYSVVTSVEADIGVVQMLYQVFLNRPADQAGLTAWVAALQAGVRDEAVIASIMSSDEFFAMAT